MPAFSKFSDNELKQLISSAQTELLMRSDKVKDEIAKDKKIISNAEGYINGLLWPERWDQRCPGGPWVSGVTKQEQEVSQKCHDAWKYGWESGFAAKNALKLRTSDPLFDLATRCRTVLRQELYTLASATTTSECIFSPEDAVRYNKGDREFWGKVLLTVSLPQRGFTFYLVVSGPDFYAISPAAVSWAENHDLSYSTCRKK